MIDTGTDGILVSENLVASLGISFPNKDPSHGITIGGNLLRRFILPDYDMETSSPMYSPLSHGIWLRHLKVNGLTNIEPEGHTNFFGADGILGTGLLNNLGAVLFDGSKQEVTVVFGGNLTVKERDELGFSSAAAAITSTPIKTSTNGLFTVPVTLENKGISENETLLVDTGSDKTTLSREATLALQLQSTAQTLDSGLGGIRKVENAPIKTLKIGSLILHNISVCFPSEDKDAPVILQAKGGVTDTLGMNILSGYQMLFDFPAHRMYIMPDLPEVKIITQ